MTIKEGKLDGCSITKNGQCALHGIEVERRRGTEKRLSSIEKDIDDNHANIGDLLTFKNNTQGYVKGIGVFAVLIIIGSYTYTFNYKQDARDKHSEMVSEMIAVKSELKSEIISLKAEVNSQRSRLVIVERDSSLTNERYVNLDSKVDRFDRRLEQLVMILTENNKVKKVKLEKQE